MLLLPNWNIINLAGSCFSLVAFFSRGQSYLIYMHVMHLDNRLCFVFNYFLCLAMVLLSLLHSYPWLKALQHGRALVQVSFNSDLPKSDYVMVMTDPFWHLLLPVPFIEY